MPSEPMNIQEQGFRSSLFGFDKNDVLAYMSALADETQQHEMEYEQKLRQLQKIMSLPARSRPRRAMQRLQAKKKRQRRISRSSKKTLS